MKEPDVEQESERIIIEDKSTRLMITIVDKNINLLSQIIDEDISEI